MDWQWSTFLEEHVRQTVLQLLVGGSVCIYPSSGAPLARIPLTGQGDQVTGEVGSSGRAVRVVLESKAGEALASIAATKVLEDTELERGAKVTLTVKVL